VSKSKSQTDHGEWSTASEALFQASRADHDPTASDRARVRRALANRLGGSAAATLTVDSGKQVIVQKSARGMTVGKLVKVAVCVACVGAGVPLIMHPLERARTPLAAAPAATVFAARAAPAPNTHDHVAPLNLPQSDSDHPTRVAARRARMPAKSTPQSKPRTRALRAHAAKSTNTTPTNDVTLASSHAASADAASPSPADANAPNALQNVDTHAALMQSASREPASRVTHEAAHNDEFSDARAELALVERIQAAMRNAKPTTALALCAEHERRWPHGTFAQEREGVRAIASCDTHSHDAGSRARTFLADHPSAPLAPRVSSACATQLSAAAD
jgi:hypothetical protein